MSSINQILNNALMESVNEEELNEGVGKEMLANFKKNTGLFNGPKHKGSSKGTFTFEPNPDKTRNTLGDDKHHTVSRAMKGVALGTAGLGAGGAIAYETEKNKDSKASKSEAQPATSANKNDPDKDTTPYTPPSKSYLDKAKGAWDDLPDAGKYGLGATAALGAGLGAVALAKKLRSKKAAAKK